MRAMVLAALLAAPSLASPKPADAKDRKGGHQSAVDRSSASAEALPVFAPTTATITVPLILSRLEEFDRKVNTLSAQFRQYVRWDESGVAQSVEGTLEFRKPNLLRIEHRLPESQTLVADGSWLWIWRHSTNQVIQTRLEEWKKSEPLAQGLMDFGNYAELLKRYDVAISTVSPAGSDGYRDVELLLRPKIGAASADKKGEFLLRLRLSTKDFFPADAELRVEQVTVHSIFEKIRFNPKLPEERFQFSPPPGAEVFQNFRPPKSE